jgi:competence protein ComEC
MLLCLWACGLGLGLLLGFALGEPSWWVATGALAWLVGAVGLWRRGFRVLAAAGALGLLGLGLGLRAVVLAPADARAPAPEVSVEGRWVRTLRWAAEGTPGIRGLIDLRLVAGAPAQGRAAVTVLAGALPMPGDRVRLRTRLSPPWGLRNPGLPDPLLQARAQGIDLVGTTRTLEVVQAGSAWAPRRLAEQAHGRLRTAIAAVVPPARAGLLAALVLGERTAAGTDVEAGFKAAGAVHALSVSGLHLTAIAGALFLLLRRGLLLVPALALRTRPAVLAAALAMPAVLFYCLLTGEATATQRSALMAALALGAVVVGRWPSLSSAFGASALVLLIDAPLLLLDPSFQLSFASVAALAVLSGAWKPLPPRLGRLRRVVSWVGRGLAASTAAFLSTAPLAAHHFGELAPASPLGNLALVPPVELGIVPLGLLGAVLGAIWRPLGIVPLSLADWLCRLVLWLAAGFQRLAPVVPLPSPDGLEALLLFVAALLLLRATTKRARQLALAGVAVVLLGAGHLGWRALARRLRTGVTVTFLDVGQGDAALIEGPRGFVALVDGGGNVDGTFDPGARVIEPVLRRKLIGHLDLVILSHPHPDHLKGLFRVLERFPVGALWTSGDRGDNPDYDRLLALAQRRGVALAPPRPRTQDGLALEPLAPWVGDSIAPPEGVSVNDASLVVRLGFAGRRVLFTGDIEEQGEAELLGRLPPRELASDVLKVPHHGSRTSSGDELLRVVAPARAVMSLGRNNRFGFPRAEVLARYQRAGIAVLRTDWNGALVIDLAVDGTLRTTCARSCR